jgi:hypothetical protein
LKIARNDRNSAAFPFKPDQRKSYSPALQPIFEPLSSEATHAFRFQGFRQANALRSQTDAVAKALADAARLALVWPQLFSVADFPEADFETTSRLAGRKPPMRSSCPASDNFRFARDPPAIGGKLLSGLYFFEIKRAVRVIQSVSGMVISARRIFQ